MIDGIDEITRARTEDPETSYISASMLTTAQSHCRALLIEAYLISLTDAPLFTDEAIANRAGLPMPMSGAWKRCSDLRELRLIRWVYRRKDHRQRKVMGSNGRLVGVSEITEAGRCAAKQYLNESP